MDNKEITIESKKTNSNLLIQIAKNKFYIRATEGSESADFELNKTNAKKLRDFLNNFLGE